MAFVPTNHAIRWRERIGILVIGLTANTTMGYAFDYGVFTWLVATYGLLGLLYALCAAIVFDLGRLWFYDLTGQDWLGIEAIKGVRDKPAESAFCRFVKAVMTRGDVASFFYLSLKHDPFITVVYMRHGSGNHRMTPRDWKIFWASTLVANSAWGLVVFGAVEAFRAWIAPHL